MLLVPAASAASGALSPRLSIQPNILRRKCPEKSTNRNCSAASSINGAWALCRVLWAAVVWWSKDACDVDDGSFVYFRSSVTMVVTVAV